MARVIVVAVDDSSHSYHALEWALDVFFVPGSQPTFKLVVVHARPVLSSVIGFAGPGSVDVLPMVERDLKKTADSIMKKAQEICTANSVNGPTMEVVEGDPRDVMIEAAEKHKASILVVGSHGYGGFKRVLLGSVSDYLCHHAHCSVMVVKKPNKTKDN